jgi:hypothetical protein
MGSGEMIALQTSLKGFPKIPFAYKRASVPLLQAKPAARFMDRDARQLSLYLAGVFFAANAA